jgi:hypothetical protein
LIEPTTGYTVALPGHPQIVATPDGMPAYDVVVQLRDVPVELGFRIDDVPNTGMDPKALAHSFVMAYASNRGVVGARPPRIDPLPPENRPVGTIGGALAIYRLRDTDADPVMEQVYILLRPSPSGLWCLTHTTRFRASALDVFEWSNLRAAIYDQHHWNPDSPRDRPTPIWPTESEIAICGAKLDLTPAGWQEAAAKAALIGQLSEDHGLALVEPLMAFVQTNDPPSKRIDPIVFPLYMQRIASIGPGNVAEAMLRNIERCRTTHDIRAWAWQCMWAIARQDKIAAHLS